VLSYLGNARMLRENATHDYQDDLIVACDVVRRAQHNYSEPPQGGLPWAYRIALLYHYGLHYEAAMWHWFGIASAEWWPWRGKWTAEKYEQAKRDWMESDRALFIVPDCGIIVAGLPDVQRKELAALADYYEAHKDELPPKKPAHRVRSIQSKKVFAATAR
jgi:hypothetical protein